MLPLTRPSIDEQTIAAVGDVLRSGWITTGPKARELEARLSDLFGGRVVRLFNSGTLTLEVALQLAGIGPGDEVITTPMTWVATGHVILRVGARPVFVDVDRITRNLDLDRVEAVITPRSRAILPVDLAGLPVDRDRLYSIATRHGLRVIEDAAQSMGSSWRGRLVGVQGDFVSFSLHANKNVTAGEGGCLVLPSGATATLIERCERMRLLGVKRGAVGEMEVDEVGYKGNLSDVAATIALGQLQRLHEFTARRKALARRYFECLDGIPGLELPPADFENANWHMFQVLLPRQRINRAQVVRRLEKYGIETGVHYPVLHLLAVYRRLGYRQGDFPVAEDVGLRTLTLPLFPAMQDDDVHWVCSALRRALRPADATDAMHRDDYSFPR